MKTIHLVIADLFLPKELAAEACAGLHLSAIGKLLSRGHNETLEPMSLESSLGEWFGLSAGAGIASLGAVFEGLGQGHWLRADPVHLRMQGNQMVLLADMDVAADEAGELCAALNAYFAGQGMEFFAPHPQRWYVRLDKPADIETVPLSLVAGRNIGDLLPGGAEATRWRQVFNEMQMLLFAHPLNEVREARGELPVNSVWLWGEGGTGDMPQKTCDSASSDEALAEMFAAAAGMPFAAWSPHWRGGEGSQLLVFTGLRAALQRGDLAGWRSALQDFETGYAQPLWQALRAGRISRLQIDVLGGDGNWRASLTRADAWAFWRRSKQLTDVECLQ